MGYISLSKASELLQLSEEYIIKLIKCYIFNAYYCKEVKTYMLKLDDIMVYKTNQNLKEM